MDHAHAHVDSFPPEVKDLLSSNSRKQGLWYPAQVAVQACFITLAAEERFTTQKPQPANRAPPFSMKHGYWFKSAGLIITFVTTHEQHGLRCGNMSVAYLDTGPIQQFLSSEVL